MTGSTTVSIPAADLDRWAGMLERYSHDLSGSVPGYGLSQGKLAADMRRAADSALCRYYDPDMPLNGQCTVNHLPCPCGNPYDTDCFDYEPTGLKPDVELVEYRPCGRQGAGA